MIGNGVSFVRSLDGFGPDSHAIGLNIVIACTNIRKSIQSSVATTLLSVGHLRAAHSAARTRAATRSGSIGPRRSPAAHAEPRTAKMSGANGASRPIAVDIK